MIQRRHIIVILMAFIAIVPCRAKSGQAVAPVSGAQPSYQFVSPNRMQGIYTVTSGTDNALSHRPQVVRGTAMGTYGTQSLRAISAANFTQLNSEGGACYIPSSISEGPRKAGRPGGSGGIGVIEVESPLGDAPVGLILLLCGIWIISRAKNLSGKLQKK